jgi:menaquinol-cytochrome c reductase cytochrome b/c subunit
VAEAVRRPAGVAPAGGISEEKRQRLLELVRGRTAARPTDLAEDEVMVWPTLVVVEALSAVIFTFLLTTLSIFVNPPLVEVANSTVTPNPSKAPWYFLNLQELLLHMHPSLAGVLVPTGALVAIAAIPFIDRSPLGVGILFTSDKGKRITSFSVVFTTIVLIALIVFDQYVGVTKTLAGKVPEIVYEQLIPVAVMVFFSVLLGVLVKLAFQPTRREMVMAFFTGFVTSYFVLTIVGTFFRGQGMVLDLYWPWQDLHAHHAALTILLNRAA